jgi:hypothetical protein
VYEGVSEKRGVGGEGVCDWSEVRDSCNHAPNSGPAAKVGKRCHQLLREEAKASMLDHLLGLLPLLISGQAPNAGLKAGSDG